MATEETLRVDTGTNAPTPPAIAAAFLVKFDHRKGYVIDWQRCIDGVQVEDGVETKSLPSGLHNVEDDLVYFIHGDNIGLSAYINRPDVQAERNATMLAVGVLVPLHQGRMGKSWLHADGLKALAKKTILDQSDLQPLEKYWEVHRIQPSQPAAPPDESTDDLFIPKKNGQTNGFKKYRSISTGSTFMPGTQPRPAHHPAATLVELLNIFGPLIFPVYRAALLRTRILIVTEAPVEFACTLVYNLSILASLPPNLLSVLPSSTPTTSLRLRPLFTVGISDIPLLSSSKQSPGFDSGWVACTTDDVLATKPDCFDMVVFLPSRDAQKARRKIYPRIVESSPELTRTFPRTGVKATQRDAERYAILREGLRNVPATEVESGPVEETANETTADQTTSAITDNFDSASTLSVAETIQERRQVVESASWSQVAYTSLLWWASAGDRRVGLTESEEEGRDIDLAMLDPPELEVDGNEGRTKEIVMVSFFRRLTTVMFEGAAEVVERASGEGGDGEYRDDDDDEEGEERQVDANDTPNRDVRAGLGFPEDGEQERELPQQQKKVGDDSEEIAVTEDPDDGTGQQPLLPLPSSSKSQARGEEDQADQEPIRFSSQDISSMSLDVWSSSDRKFIQDFTQIWWGRSAEVSGGGGLECCGVKIL